jgi:hypothetical protein
MAGQHRAPGTPVRGEGGRLQSARAGTAKAASAARTAGNAASGAVNVSTPGSGSKSAGIILLAGVITIGNEFLQTPGATFSTFARPAMATVATAWVFAGLEKLDQDAAVGLAAIVMITVLIGGVSKAKKSPAQEVLSLIGKKA